MIKAIIFDCFGVLYGHDGPDETLLALIRDELRPSLKIGLLSNMGSDMLDELFTPEQLALLDAAVLSFRTGTTKPDHRIYELAATKLGMLPEECVFVDDSEGYCTAAREVGMRAIWHRDAAHTTAQLRELLRA